MPFKVSLKAKAIINGGFILKFHDNVHLKILLTPASTTLMALHFKFQRFLYLLLDRK